MGSGNRHYKNGADFERRVKARLEEVGWTVFRTAGSHSPADLIAIRRTRFWAGSNASPQYGRPSEMTLLRFYQCKGGSTTLGPKALREFAAFAYELGAEPWLAERGMKFTRIAPTWSTSDVTKMGATERTVA